MQKWNLFGFKKNKHLKVNFVMKINEKLLKITRNGKYSISLL